MFVYWLDTAVIVFYSVLKVVTVGGPITLLWMPGHLAFFGVFMSFHLMMILALGPTPPGGFFPPDVIRELFRRTWSAGIGLVVSHGISFVVNFLGNGEYRHTTVNEQIAAPWKRVLIMHATTFVGAWSVMLFEAPVGALVMLAVLKIVVDLHGHLRERRVNSEAESSRSPQVPATTIEGVLGLFGAFLVFCGVVLAAGRRGQGFRGGRRSPFGDRPIAVAPIARAPGGRVAESLERPAVPACPGAVLVWWGRAMVAPEVPDERERRTDYVRGRRRVGQDDPDDAARAMASPAGAEGGAHARAGRDSARRRGVRPLQASRHAAEGVPRSIPLHCGGSAAHGR